MSSAEADDGQVATANATSRGMLWVVFVLLFVFSYSEEIIGLLFDLAGFGKHNDWRSHLGWRLGLLAIEVAALAVVGLKKRSIERADGDGPRLWRMWWGGFAVLILLDAVLSELPFMPSVWVLVAAAIVIATSMGVLMATSLNADPRTLLSAERRAAHPTDWRRTRAVVPLVVGTFASYVAAIAYTRLIDTDTVRTLPADIAEQAAALPLAERDQPGVFPACCRSHSAAAAHAGARIQLLPKEFAGSSPSGDHRGDRGPDVGGPGVRDVHAAVRRRGLL